MLLRVTSILLLTLHVATSSNLFRRQIHPNQDQHTIIDAVQELALDISSNQLSQGRPSNVVLSPISISALLSLLQSASKGQTKFQLKTALHFPNDFSDESIHKAYGTILGSIQSGDGIEVSMSSRLFLQDGFNVLGEFTNVAKNSYKSSVVPLDFAGAPSASKDIVNKWINDATRGKIPNLISSPFSPATKLVAANAIYFDGTWENEFSKLTTSDGIFNTGTKKISIPMMRNVITVPYLRGPQLGFDMIALPYTGRKYSMYILTPHGNPGSEALQNVEFSLSSAVLDQLIQRMEPQKVSVTIPRMKLRHKINLNRDLKSLGVTDIFNPSKANFGELTHENGVFLSDILHEAVIEVTEIGTKAAAATATVIDRIGTSNSFQLDRPSIVFIRDNTNGLILFWARVIEPQPIHST